MSEAMNDTTQTHVELREYDSDMDDRRGGSRRVGYYRSRATAQAKADHLNQENLDEQNRAAASLHRQAVEAARTRQVHATTIAIEHNALVEAGLRSGLMMIVPDPNLYVGTVPSLVPKTALRKFSPPEDWVPQVTTHGNRTYTERWHAENHYYVDDLDYEDES